MSFSWPFIYKKEVIIKTGWNKHPYTTSPDKEGNWKIEVPTPSAGGPYEIIISDGEEHILQNILIGEIWLYTGECETETPIDIPSQPYIRLFQTKKEISLVPKKDLHATQEGWKECTSETITGLPAIGYFLPVSYKKPESTHRYNKLYLERYSCRSMGQL